MRAGRSGVPFVRRSGWSRSTGGGGKRSCPRAPFGKLLTWLLTEEPYVVIGGLLIVCVREGSAGRPDGGGGGGALLPAAEGANPRLWFTPSWFRAAIRAARELNWGSESSSSGIVKGYVLLSCCGLLRKVVGIMLVLTADWDWQ